MDIDKEEFIEWLEKEFGKELDEQTESDGAYEFENGAKAWIEKKEEGVEIYMDDEDGNKFKIKGFDSVGNARDFIFFGDFSEKENAYLNSTGSKEKLEWVYL
jgi:uncharacterized protein YxeA